MYRFVLLLVCFLAVGYVEVKSTPDVQSCMNMGKFAEDCCEYEVSEKYKAIHDECSKKTHSKESCDFYVCFGKAEGFFRANGTFDKITLEELLEKDFEKDTDVSDVLKEKCLSEDLASYIQEDPCYLKELGNCLSFYYMLNCKNWNESDECKKVKTELEECQKLLP